MDASESTIGGTLSLDAGWSSTREIRQSCSRIGMKWKMIDNQGNNNVIIQWTILIVISLNLSVAFS